MVATFPLPLSSISNDLRVVSGLWTPVRSEEVTGLGSAEVLTHDLAPMVWGAEVELAPMYMETFKALRARLMLLDGARNSFLFASPEALAPQADPTGSILGASTVQIHTVGGDNKTLRLKGLPAGYVITEGDFFGVTYSTSRRALYVACETVTADGTGNTALFEVRSYLRPGTAANNAVSLTPPVAKVKILPDTLDWSVTGQIVRARFRIQQTLAA